MQNCLGLEGYQWEGGEDEEDEVVHREHGQSTVHLVMAMAP